MEYQPFTIYGDVPCKSNSYKVIQRNGHGSMAKTLKLKEYERSFYLQCPLRNANIGALFKIDVEVFFSSNRKDLDGSFKIILDCLQMTNTIRNDRQCVEIRARKLLDKEKPRVVIRITTENV